MARIHDNANPQSQVNTSTSGILSSEKISDSRSNACQVGKWLNRIVLVLIVAIGLFAGLALIFRGSANPFDLFTHGRLPTVKDTERWDVYGFKGLQLVVENALEDSWTPYLEEYVSEWDQGSPDALELSVQRVSVDSSCQPSTGVLKICNGDYGNTDWIGVNYNMVQNGFIIHSVSQMNDYHLNNMNDDDKRYTMCHEMGHGFGLPHTDENYSNTNLGNCLDYTMHVQGNLSPGAFNYNLLSLMYGTIPPSQRKLKKDHVIPDSVIEKYKTLSEEMKSLPREHCHSGRCAEDLGEGYSLIMHKLLLRNLT